MKFFRGIEGLMLSCFCLPLDTFYFLQYSDRNVWLVAQPSLRVIQTFQMIKSDMWWCCPFCHYSASTDGFSSAHLDRQWAVIKHCIESYATEASKVSGQLPKNGYHCFIFCYMHWCILRHLHNHRAPTVKVMSWIIMIASMPQKREGMKRGRRNRLGVKALR